jgi:hypothetical protein
MTELFVAESVCVLICGFWLPGMMRLTTLDAAGDQKVPRQEITVCWCNSGGCSWMLECCKASAKCAEGLRKAGAARVNV